MGSWRRILALALLLPVTWDPEEPWPPLLQLFGRDSNGPSVLGAMGAVVAAPSLHPRRRRGAWLGWQAPARSGTHPHSLHAGGEAGTKLCGSHPKAALVGGGGAGPRGPVSPRSSLWDLPPWTGDMRPWAVTGQLGRPLGLYLLTPHGHPLHQLPPHIIPQRRAETQASRHPKREAGGGPGPTPAPLSSGPSSASPQATPRHPPGTPMPVPREQGSVR